MFQTLPPAPQICICVILLLKMHKPPYSKDHCKSMLSIKDDSSITSLPTNMNQLKFLVHNFILKLLSQILTAQWQP